MFSWTNSRIIVALIAVTIVGGTSAISAAFPTTHTDIFDDPLPAGAIARMGTVRWRHAGRVFFVAYVADGKTMITAADDNTIRVWESATGKELRRFDLPHDLWLVNDKEKVGIAHVETPSPAIALSPDGKTFACGGARIDLFDVDTGKLRRQFTSPFAVSYLAFSADGKCLAGRAMQKPNVVLWDVVSGKELRRLGKKDIRIAKNSLGGDPPLPTVAFTPKGDVLATEIDGSIIQLWETKSGKDVRQIKLNQEGLSSLTFSPDGKLLAWANKKTIYLWDIGENKLFKQLEGHHKVVDEIVFSTEGKLLISRNWREPLRLWNVAGGKELRQFGEKRTIAIGGILSERIFNSHAQGIALSPDGKTVAASGPDHLPRIWDLATGRELTSDVCHRSRISSIATGPDGNILISKGDDELMIRWDSRQAKERRRARLTDGSLCAAFANNGAIIATGGADGKDRLWNAETGETVCEFPGEREFPVKTNAISRDGKTLASGNIGDRIHLWNTETGKKIRDLAGVQTLWEIDFTELFNGAPFIKINADFPLAFSPDGKTLAAVWPENTICLRDVASGKTLRNFVAPGAGDYRFVRFAFSPDGKILASGSPDNTIILWETATGKERGRFKGHKGGVVSLAFSADGKLLVSGGEDRTLRLWNLATMNELATFPGHQGAITALVFSADGRKVFSASADTTVLVWDIGKK